MNHKVGIDIYMLPYIKQIASGDLLYSTGVIRSGSSGVGQGGRGRSKREEMCAYTELIHFVIVQQKLATSQSNYTSIKNENKYKSTEIQASQVPLVVKNPLANAGDISNAGSITGSGRSPGGGHNNPLQYSCLENPMDRGAWQATVRGVAKSRTRLKQLSMHPQCCMVEVPN